MKGLTTKAIVLFAAAALCLTADSQDIDVGPDEYLKPPVLRDVMWQILPDKVRGVTVGPDGRVWWELGFSQAGIRYQDAREVIEEQFHSKSPALIDARPVLFEPGGRVWFSFSDGYYLCGYNGERWIEYQEKQYPRSWGVRPNHGRRGYNYVIQGQAFFLAARGIRTFDPQTETLSYQPILEKNTAMRHLVPEPDGAGILAWYAPRQKTPLLWRWRDGEWTQIALPPDIDSERIAGIAAAENGIWIDEQDTPATRYRAKKLGVTLRTGLRLIPFDPEGFEEDEEQDVDKHFAAGPYTAKGVMLDFYDTFDTTYVRAKEILKEGKSLGPGMLIKRRDGKVSVVLGKRFALPWAQRHNPGEPDSGPILVPEKEAAWFPGRKAGAPAQLHSLKNGELLATICDRNFRWLHAALPDGTVIARDKSPGYSEFTMAAFKPGAGDDRNLLHCERIEMTRAGFCIAADGTVWTETTGSPEGQAAGRAFIARFDGRQWKPAKPFGNIRDVGSFLPGQNGELLVEANGTFFFLVGDKLYTDRDPEALIAAHRKEFAAAYFMNVNLQRGTFNNYFYKPFSVVADKTGNIWLHRRDPNSLKVLTGNGWLDTGAHLGKMGLPDRVRSISTVGDGKLIYLTAYRPTQEGQTSFYGKVSDGKIVLAPAPSNDGGRGGPRVRDHDNALWIGVRQPAGQRHGRPAYRRAIFRLFGDREQEVPLRTGYPALCDNSGNVWLWTGASKAGRGTFDIWSEGKLPQAVVVPGMSPLLISDRPGSVFAWSTNGIYHLTAEDPNDPAKYTVKTLYAIDGLKGKARSVKYSSPGYMVVSTSNSLYLIKLPKPEEE